MKKSHRISGIILIALILTVATFAFAAANTMPAASYAGDGSTTISGYTITAIDYTLNNANPAVIETVEFNISPVPPAATGEVEIQLDGSTWVSTCSWTAAGAVTCPIGGAVTAVAATSLRIVAAD